MRPYVALVLGAFAFAWFTHPVLAEDSPAAKMPTSAMDMRDTQPTPVMLDGGQNCGQSCGENCGPCCGNDAECGHFVGAVGFLLLKPHLQNIAIRSHLEFRDPATGDFHAVNTITDFHDDLEIGPRLWFGWVGQCGLGARVRWMHLDESANVSQSNNGPSVTTPGTENILTLISASPFFGQPGFHNDLGAVNDIDAGIGDRLATHSKIEFDVWDLEATQVIRRPCWWALVTGGVRYAHIKESYTAQRIQFSPVVPFPVRDILNSSNNIDSFGPTVSFEFHRPIGRSGFALYASARGSLLFGDRSEHADLSSFAFRTGDERIHETFDKGNEEVLPIGELEIGGEWSGCIGHMVPFVQVAMVGENWFNVGTASSEHGDLGFFGLSVMFGLNY